jgi:hypothetical protein
MVTAPWAEPGPYFIGLLFRFGFRVHHTVQVSDPNGSHSHSYFLLLSAGQTWYLYRYHSGSVGRRVFEYRRVDCGQAFG